MTGIEQLITEGPVTEADELRCKLQRLQADFTNYKRRAERESEEQTIMSNEKLISKLLPVLDDFGRALNDADGECVNGNWVQGVSLIEQNLRSILEKEGLSKMQVCDTEFDPQQHEAVVIEKGRIEEQGKVKRIMRDGYSLHGKVIRPAQVSVIKGLLEETQNVDPWKVPRNRGGNAGWKRRPRVVPNARGTYL